jgi:hypothetical protein
MGTRNKRTARRFQVEPLETRWTPGGASGAALLSGAVHHIGQEIPRSRWPRWRAGRTQYEAARRAAPARWRAGQNPA